jgi:hypothetical protein
MIFAQLTEQLKYLTKTLASIPPNKYTIPIKCLSGASIGGHSRHIVELLECIVKGYQTGTVDYINRERNLYLEQDIKAVLEKISFLENQLIKADKTLHLVCEGEYEIVTNYFREIVYNTEHIIHHLAIIKAALIELNMSDCIDENFGVAYSTIQYKQKLAELKSDETCVQ